MNKIKLTNSDKYFLIDSCDIRKISKYKWHLRDGKYVCAGPKFKGPIISLARYLLNTPKGMIADHKNGDTLDNRRVNLRNCSPSESAQNRGGWSKKNGKYKGVYLDRKRKKYRAVIVANGVSYSLSRHDTQEDAAREYDTWAKKLHGEFARLNFK